MAEATRRIWARARLAIKQGLCVLDAIRHNRSKPANFRAESKIKMKFNPKEARMPSPHRCNAGRQDVSEPT